MGTLCSKPKKLDKQQVASKTGEENVAATSSKPVISQEEEVKEYSVCNINDLQDNEMKVYKVGEGEVLVVKEKGTISVLGTKCTHYNAPLNTGIVCNGKVICPWHGACFNSKTGDIEDFPALDPIPNYPVRIDPHTNEVKIKISVNVLKSDRVLKPLCARDNNNNSTVVIIGSGGAGHSCAETLRQEGFTGRIVMVTKETFLPYDRPKLSKAMNMDGHKLELRTEDYYKKGDIEILQGTSVEGVDVETRSVLLDNGNSINFTHLVIATGGRPRKLPCPGTHLSNVCLLRNPIEANFIAKEAEDRRVVIVGTSFIGMEVAAFLVGKAASVTVIGRSTAPFSNVFGEAVGKQLQSLHEEKGVHFILGTEVAELRGDEEGKMNEVVLVSGQVLTADLLVTGLGVLPSTDFLRGSDIVLDSRGYVPVDEFMRTNCQDIYAAGDIASFPLNQSSTGAKQAVNIGHWQMALHHGRTVALSILGRPKSISETAVPFFWSSMFGKSIRYCGYVHKCDDIILHGSLDKMQFAAFYCQEDIVGAVATMGFDPLAAQFAALLSKGQQLLKSEITDDPRAWLNKLV